MIYMITGGFNTGKTTRLSELCIEKKKYSNQIGGFISEKIIKNQLTIGYAIRNITTNRRVLLACDSQYFESSTISRKILINQFSEEIEMGLEVHFNDYYQYDRFMFCKDAFNYANTLISNLALSSDIDEIIIDEIGKIELMGDGYFIGLISAVKSNKTVYLCVKDDYVKDVIDLIESIHHTFNII